MKKSWRVLTSTMKISLSVAPGSYLFVTISTVLYAVLAGPIMAKMNQIIFDSGLDTATKKSGFSEFLPWMLLYAVCLIMPSLLSTLNNSIFKPQYLAKVRTGASRIINEKCLKIKYRYFEDSRSADIMQQVNKRFETVVRMVSITLLSNILISVVNFAGVFLLLFPIAWWLPFTVLIPIIIFNLQFSKINRRVFEKLDKQFAVKRFSDALVPFLTKREYQKEMHFFRAFTYIQDIYLKRLQKYNREYEELYAGNLKQSVLWYVFLDACKALNSIAILFLFLSGQITIGFFISIVTYIFSLNLHLPFGSFGMWSFFYDQYDSFMQFEEYHDGSITELPGQVSIAFDDVWFAYPGTEKDILRGISLEINQGDKAAIVGRNGAGKSTIFKLLLGLYEPDKGRILLNGKDLFSYSIKVRVKLFAVVFQDFVQYQLTLRENLTLGNGAADSVLQQAAVKGNIENLAGRLGYDQLLGRDFAGGVDLSGGEWQRVAMARVFAGGHPVVLLDEPTSQMDPIAESRLYGQFAEVIRDKTAILISHRLGSTKMMDKIFLIDEGVVAEAGSHESLMKNQKLYAQMYTAQKGWYESGAAYVQG